MVGIPLNVKNNSTDVDKVIIAFHAKLVFHILFEFIGINDAISLFRTRGNRSILIYAWRRNRKVDKWRLLS